jgi:tetratricopeptide (TPR) repeat protein
MQSSFAIVILVLQGLIAHGQASNVASTATKDQTVPDVAAAQRLVERGELQDAAAMLEQLEKKQPPVKGVAHELGIVYYRSGKLLQAEAKFAQASLEDPADVESIQMRGLTLYRLGRPATAIPYLERVRQWNPNANADANYVLGLCYLNSQRYGEARAAFAAQYGVASESESAYLVLARMLLQANLPELALVNAQKALEIAPKLPLAHFLQGEVYLYKSEVERARDEFEKERGINPGYAPTYDRLGDVYTRTEKYQEAQESLMRAIALDTSSTGPFIQMGKVLLRRNDPRTALLYLQHAEKMDPSNFITHTLLGQAYRALGREQEAQAEIDTASKIHAASMLKIPPVE